ncbi:hypothetical protein [Paraburkholderia acidicola]|nr:hypothetical protein [Paraburkholderia acidicola]
MSSSYAGKRMFYVPKAFFYIQGAVASVLLNVVLYFYLANFHDGTSIPAMLSAYTAHTFQFKATTILLAFLLGPMIVISGMLAGRLWHADTSQYHQLSWIALISDIAFLGAWGAAIGLGLAAMGVQEYSPQTVSYTLIAGFASIASVLGVLWAPFGFSCFCISVKSGLLPGWLNILTLIAVLMNCCAVFGMFTMTGPFNPINGQIAAGFPFYGPVTWFNMVLAWLLSQMFSRR